MIIGWVLIGALRQRFSSKTQWLVVALCVAATAAYWLNPDKYI